MNYERLFGNPVCYEIEATLPNQQKALLHLMHPTDPSRLSILVFSQPCQRSFNFGFHLSFGLLSFSSFNFLSTFSTFKINTTMSNNDPHSQSAPRSPHDILVHGRSEDSQDSMNISPLNSIDNMDNVSLIATNSPHTVIAPQLTFLRSPQSGRAQPELDFTPDSQHFAPRAPSTLIPVDEGVKCEKDPPAPLTLASQGSPPQCTDHNDHATQPHYENVTFVKPQDVTIVELAPMEIKKGRSTWSPERRAAYKAAYKENMCNPRKAAFWIHHIFCLAVILCILGLILGWFD